MFASDHPNVVRVNYACETASTVALAMKYYANGSPRDLTAKGPLSLARVIEIAQGILSGLGFIHRQRLIHFDVKPSNVLFDDNKGALVADFGQTRMIGPGGWALRPGMYRDGIPPECYGGVGVQQSDIYQVALTLYRAVNGDALFEEQRQPLSDAEAQQLTLSGDFPDRSRFLPHIPTALRQVICQALEIDPRKRFQTCRDFADALGKISIGTDWNVTPNPDGSISWVAGRDGHPDTLVQLMPCAGRWAVEIHTCRGAEKRRKSCENWRSDVTHKQATLHLRQVFRWLGKPMRPLTRRFSTGPMVLSASAIRSGRHSLQ
jgi:serine/threonine protein kinase